MDWKKRKCTLANGFVADVVEVSASLALLERFLEGSPMQREFATFLREESLAKGSGRSEMARAAFAAEPDMLDPDGGIGAVLKNVIHTSVRGEGNNLYLVSPFTDPVDRALSDLVISKRRLEDSLDPSEAKAYKGASLEEYDASRYKDGAPENRTWLDEVLKRRSKDGGMPPPSAN